VIKSVGGIILTKNRNITLETVQQCPVCGNETFSPYLNCVDYLVSQKTFDIQECTKCQFRLTNPRPDAGEIGSYYKSDQYISHNDTGGGLISSVYRSVRSYTLRQKLQLINRLNNGAGRLLDVGCGTGAFLETCQQGRWTVAGMEPDSNARSVSEKKINGVITPDLTSVSTNEPFDAITLWHVLEHIPDLANTIQLLHTLTTTDGTVLIAVPNSDSYDAKFYKEYWAAYDVPRHLHHFTPSTIEPLFRQHGFVLADKQPMLFDAFYIAMLSSRYRTGKTDYLESIRVGLASNTKAKRTGQASSMIYMFKKAR